MSRCLPLLAVLPLLACAATDDGEPAAARGAAAGDGQRGAAALALQLSVHPESLNAAGEELYGRQSYDSAQLVFRVEAGRAAAARQPAAEARARTWLGLAAWRLGDYATAGREGERAIALKRIHRLDHELSRSYNALGLLRWNEGRLRESQAWFDSALAAARRHDDARGVARAAANVPLVLTQLGDYDGARRGFENAIAAGRRLDDARVEGNGRANLAMLETRLGNYGLAIEHLAEARRSYARIDYRTGDANALGQAATAWAAMGDLRRAMAAAREGLGIAREQSLAQEIAAIHEVLADLHVGAGDARGALALLSVADSVNSSLGLEVERGNNLRRQGAILLELGEIAVAITRTRAALAVHVATADSSEQLQDRLLLAELLSRSADHSAADSQADTAASLAGRLGPASLRLAALTRARLALAAGRPRVALGALDEVPRERWRPDWMKHDLEAAALVALGRWREARVASEAAVAAMSRERGSFDLGPLRAHYLGGRLALVDRLVDIRLRLGDTLGALHVAAAIPGSRLAGPSAAAFPESEAHLRRIAALQAQLDSAPQGTVEREALMARVMAERRSFQTLAAEHPESSGAELPVMPPDGSLLLLYLVAGDHSHRFSVAGTAVRHSDVAAGARDLAERVRVVRAGLPGPGRRDAATDALRQLGRLLLGALDDTQLAGVSRLLVVPHGALTALPFTALFLPPSGGHVVERYTVTILPSAFAHAGRPMNRSASRLALFAPIPDSLPGTAREVRAIAGIYPSSEVWLGRRADEPAVREALGGGSIVHLASHGALDATNPLFSMMRVAPVPGSDGRLEAHEIMAMRVRSPLVFLSGCETGVGAGTESIIAGSDEGSLAQALLQAGAGAVVATLWRINDREASRMATSFYRFLGRYDASQALALAQREALRAGQSYTWAAYMSVGFAAANTTGPIR